jgi:hypothetical protein
MAAGVPNARPMTCRNMMALAEKSTFKAAGTQVTAQLADVDPEATFDSVTLNG